MAAPAEPDPPLNPRERAAARALGQLLAEVVLGELGEEAVERDECEGAA